MRDDDDDDNDNDDDNDIFPQGCLCGPSPVSRFSLLDSQPFPISPGCWTDECRGLVRVQTAAPSSLCSFTPVDWVLDKTLVCSVSVAVYSSHNILTPKNKYKGSLAWTVCARLKEVTDDVCPTMTVYFKIKVLKVKAGSWADCDKVRWQPCQFVCWFHTLFAGRSSIRKCDHTNTCTRSWSKWEKYSLSVYETMGILYMYYTRRLARPHHTKQMIGCLKLLAIRSAQLIMPWPL